MQNPAKITDTMQL